MRIRSATALLAVLAIAGCGGGSDDTTPPAATTAASTPAPSASPTAETTATADPGLGKAALAKQANAICRRYAKQADALGTPDVTQPAKAARYFTAATRLARRQQAEFEALAPAAGVATDYRAFVKASSNAVGLLDQLAKAAAAGDKARGAQLVKGLQPISARVDTTSHAIGAGACATD